MIRAVLLSLFGALLIGAVHAQVGQIPNWPPKTVATAPFVPTNISGMTLWLKADAGVFSDAGVTPAVNGGTSQQWNDQSGSANNCTQSTAGNRPTFDTGIIGSQPVLRFNGTSSFMSCPSIFPIAPNPFTMIVVSVQRGTSVGNVVSGTTGHALLYNSTNFINDFQNGVIELTSTTGTGTGITAFDILNEVGRSNAAQGSTDAHNLTVNGNYNTGILDTTVNSDAALQLGAFAAANFFNGDIAEILLYTKTLTIADTNNIITYINGRYGTGVSTWPTDKQVIFDGDSITAGFKGQPPWAMLTAVHEARFTANLGSAGARMSELVTQGATVVDPLFVAGVTKPIVVAFAGTNDIIGGASGATAAASAHQYCLDRHTAGWKAVWVPMLPRGTAGNETDRTTLNTTEAADACWDAKVPTSCSAAMWGAGANTSLTNYDADQVHPNATGHALIAACVETAVDSL